MTTGMSAPPIGRISRNPKASASNVRSQNAASDSVTTKIAINAIRSTPSAAFSRCWPVKISGAPETRPCNLAKATIEPVKVIAPIVSPSAISIRLAWWIWPVDADAVGFRCGEGCRRDADRGETDQAVERGDQLRQRRHLDLLRDVGADRAADDEAEQDQPAAHDRGRQQRRRRWRSPCRRCRRNCRCAPCPARTGHAAP